MAFKQNIKKNASQKTITNFFVSEVFHDKCHFQYAFDDNLIVTHVFVKQIFWAVEIAPPSPSPHRAEWLFSATCRGFGYGNEAVRIRV
jgi:hypothetical protein